MKQFLSAISICIALNCISSVLKAQANTSLSNLVSPTAVNQSLTPNATNSRDLGTSVNNWRYLYVGTGMYLNGALSFHARGAQNIFAAANAGNTTLTGSGNAGVGYNALNRLTTGNYNAAIGYAALFNTTSGYSNSASGSYALYSNTTGFGNAANGYAALYNNISGSGNVANGYYALNSNTTGTSNTGIGTTALYFNTSGNNNIGIGNASMLANTTGNNNIAIGTFSLQNNINGYSNVAIGAGAIYRSTQQSNLVAIGDSALYNNGNGGSQWQGIVNTAVGSKSLFTNTTGSYNSAFGYNSLYANTTGLLNAAVGFSALSQNTTGGSNVAVGYGALFINITGTGNTAIGASAGTSVSNLSNTTAVGSNALVNASNKVVIGNTNVTVIGGQVGWSILSDGRFKKNIQENVPGLAFINKLRPVTYNVDIEKFERFTGRKDSIIQEMKNGFIVNEKKLRTGLIAQEVEQTAQEINYDFDGVNRPQHDKDNYSIVYADFVPSLVKAVQELSKQQEALKSEILQVKSEIKALQSGNTNIHAEHDQQAVQQQSGGSKISGAGLVQNMPNPFNASTEIRYTLPLQHSSAKIVVFDHTGKTIKEMLLSSNRNGYVRFNASLLAAGTYYYALIIDGRLADTKQMLLTK